MVLAVPAETQAQERRVAVVPAIAKRLIDAGWVVSIERGAGAAAFFPDDAFVQAGAMIRPTRDELFADADLVVSVNPLDPEQARAVSDAVTVLSLLQPAGAKESLSILAAKGATVFSFDLLPRVSRSQPMDALSSQATVSGYRAGILAAERIDRFFPMLMTAAGTVPPAKVLVLGVGVAGLQAIATTRRLGAVVRAYDVRAAAREEAQSLGASFVDTGISAEGIGGYARELSEEELGVQRAALAEAVVGSDVVIATAAVPGHRAPVLVPADVVRSMAPGSVIIDLAADNGGNTELTVAGETVEVDGVAVIGVSNPAAGMPTHASALYARNVESFVGLIAPNGHLAPDWDDEIVAACAVLRDGKPSSAWRTGSAS
jgi:H+-translocating NAD(P) transhydrogenase subunit alpha